MAGSRKMNTKLRWAQLFTVILLLGLTGGAIFSIGRLHRIKFNHWELILQLLGEEEITLECGEPYQEAGAESRLYDDYYHSEGREVRVSILGKIDPTHPDRYILRYRAETETDETGRFARFRKQLRTEKVRTVIYRDTTAPVIELEGDPEPTVPYGRAYREKGYRAFDTVDGDLTGEVLREEQEEGIRYSVRDHSGNEAVVMRPIRRKDTTPPVLELKGEKRQRLPWNTPYEEEGYSALDAVEGDLTARVEREVQQDRIIYRVSDSSGNSRAVLRFIEYYDDTPPVLTLEGETEMTLAYGRSYEEPGFCAEDDRDGDLTDQIRVEGQILPTAPGVQELRYLVRDQAGNETCAIRRVTVLPRSLAPQMDVPGAEKTIYLTFDDGPGEHTGRLLDILDKYQIKATFFVTGTRPEYLPLLSRMAEEGHSIGVHSLTHNYGRIYADEKAFFADIEAMEALIRQYTGSETRLLRFPGGSSNRVSIGCNPGIMSRLTQEVEARGYVYFDWNVSSGDADTNTYQTRNSVYSFVTVGCSRKNVSVVLNHDVMGFTVDAMEDIILWGLQNGYSFKPLTADSPGMHHQIAN